MSEEIGLDDLAPWLVVLFTLIGGGLRVLLLAMKGMATDETVNVWLASQNFSNMLQWIARIHPQPPLYYWLLHGWMKLQGDAAYSVRLFSVLFGTGTIPIVYLIGKRMGSVAMGLIAAVTLVVSPFHIFYAQETSMFTLLGFNAAVAIYALVRLLTDARSSQPLGSQLRAFLHVWRTAGAADPVRDSRYLTHRRRPPLQSIATDLSWLTFIIFSAATLLSHSSAVLFFLTSNLFVLGLMFFQRGRKNEERAALQAPSLKNWGMAQLILLVLWVPWMIPLLHPGSATTQPFWNTAAQMLGAFLSVSEQIPAIATGLWILYGLMFILGLVYFRKKPGQFVFLAVLFVLPLVGELSVGRAQQQTLIWATIPLFLLLAAGISQLKFRFLLLTVLGILSTLYLFSASDYFRFFQKDEWNTAARNVAGYTEKNDLILFNSNIGEIPFNYYFQSYEDYYSLIVEKRGVPQDLFESGLPAPQMTAQDVPGLVSLLNGHDRVWLVYSGNAATDPDGLIAQTLAARMKLVQQDDFYGGEIQLYENQ